MVPSGYSEKICGLLRDFSTNPIRDILDFWNRIIFNDLIGNTDGHLKNSHFKSAVILRQLDTMAENFEKAINQAADALQEKGYKNAGTIRDKILETSGYRYL
ncbi:HipA domain-containing protein [Porcincola intestinalis]|uniref:Type II toxin-antitoxin system HipA family toxin n=1 Tax=Porcincola intestinalis TaxID=2606632 RepID=A0A6L5X6U7_9FIRM|nr:type II toxin-antitoxin system HipA family toxin [Porcincola intestinalis]